MWVLIYMSNWQLVAILPLAVVHVLGNLFTNMSLGKVAVSFTHTIKAMEPFFSVVLSAMFLGEVLLNDFSFLLQFTCFFCGFHFMDFLKLFEHDCLTNFFFFTNLKLLNSSVLCESCSFPVLNIFGVFLIKVLLNMNYCLLKYRSLIVNISHWVINLYLPYCGYFL